VVGICVCATPKGTMSTSLSHPRLLIAQGTTTTACCRNSAAATSAPSVREGLPEFRPLLRLARQRGDQFEVLVEM
jgi:hypothetical protein